MKYHDQAGSTYYLPSSSFVIGGKGLLKSFVSATIWFQAYEETQPKPVFAETTTDEKEESYTNVPKMT